LKSICEHFAARYLGVVGLLKSNYYGRCDPYALYAKIFVKIFCTGWPKNWHTLF